MPNADEQVVDGHGEDPLLDASVRELEEQFDAAARASSAALGLTGGLGPSEPTQYVPERDTYGKRFLQPADSERAKTKALVMAIIVTDPSNPDVLARVDAQAEAILKRCGL